MLYCDLPMIMMTTATAISTPGTPKANEKQVSSPKQWTSSLKMGVINVPMRAPRLMQK